MVNDLSAIIVPELFAPYVSQRTMEKSALVQSGIITQNAQFDSLASQPTAIVNMPFFEDLIGESEQIIEGASLNTTKISPMNDKAAIIRRAKMWSSTDLTAALSGADPSAAIAELVAGFWVRDMQKELIAILNGAFGSSSMVENILDISNLTGTAAKWSGSSFIDAQQLLGDASEYLTAVVMHSKTKSALKKQNLLDSIPPSENAGFDTYQGVRVIVDDSCPVSEDVYTSYLFGQGAIAYGNGNPAGFVSIETDRDKKKGSGVDYLISRKTFILHPRGIKFTSASVALPEGPSRAELSLDQNWIRVYEPKQVRIVQFKHKL